MPKKPFQTFPDIVVKAEVDILSWRPAAKSLKLKEKTTTSFQFLSDAMYAMFLLHNMDFQTLIEGRWCDFGE